MTTASGDGWDRFAAEVRTEAAALARGRRAALGERLVAAASLAGVLVDRGERGAPVVVQLLGGPARVGVVGRVGTDFVALDVGTGPGGRAGEALVPLAAVAWVLPAEGEPPVAGDREVSASTDLIEALGLRAEDRPRVRVHTTTGETLSGELRSVGLDVVVLDLDDGARRRAHVALAALAEVLVEPR